MAASQERPGTDRPPPDRSPPRPGGAPARSDDEALELAGRALARRDLSREALADRLRRAGIAQQAAAGAVAALAGAGFVDDARLARSRAATLAARGLGDAAIEARLAGEGIGEKDRAEALAGLEPEEERARRLARAAGAGAARRLAATLHRRGFGDSAVEAALAVLDARDGAELR